MKKASLLSVFVAIVILAIANVASAAPTLCWSGTGTYTNNQEKLSPLQNTYWSQWTSNNGRAYWAYRKNSSGGITYQSLRSGGPWEFVNSVDALRRTTQKNVSGTSALWYIAHWTKTSC